MRIWDDNWVLDNHGFKILGVVRGVDRETRVFDLINHDVYMWSKEIVESLRMSNIFT